MPQVAICSPRSAVGGGCSVFRAIGLCALLGFVAAVPAEAARVALVIGNADYRAPGALLTNSVGDARAVAAMLRELEFDVTEETDLSAEEAERVVNRFIRGIQAGDDAVFYYAGHGIEMSDGLQTSNYLLPVDVSLAWDEVQFRQRSLSASAIQERMELAGARVRILILDACRDNPFDGRSLGRGLGTMRPRGGLVAFAAEAGRTASDDGLFTRHLVAALGEPGLPASLLFEQVGEAVARASGGGQRPVYYSAGAGGFVFRSGRDDSPAVVEAALGLDRAARRELQAGLLAEGYPVGRLDGEFGQRTRHAIRDWQVARGEDGTGYLNEESATFLRAAARDLLSELGGLPTPSENSADPPEVRAVRSFEARLGRGLSIDSVDEGGWTDLHYAAVLNAGVVADRLLSQQAPVDAELHSTDQRLAVTLMEVARLMGEEALTLEYDTATYTGGQTPLHIAALVGADDVVAELIEHQADLEAETSFVGHRPLDYAVVGGQLGAVRLLVRHGADLNRLDGTSLVHHAAREGDVDVLRALLDDYRLSVHGRTGGGETPLHYAAREGHVDVIRTLVDRYGADPDARTEDGFRDCCGEGETALNYAAASGHIAAIETLMDYGADLSARDARGQSQLHYAAGGGDVGVIRALVDHHGLDATARTEIGETALHHAASGGHAAAIRVLLDDYGLNVNAVTTARRFNYEVQTPLHYAARSHRIAAIETLVDYGADVDARDGRGMTPLQHAADARFGSSVTAIETLIEYGADVDVRDDTGESPLHQAAGSGQVALIRMLVDYGLDVNAPDDWGETPLHKAASGYYYLDAIRVLVGLGADVTARDRDGDTPVDETQIHCHGAGGWRCPDVDPGIWTVR